MRSILLGAAAALGLFPVMASAAVSLNVSSVDTLMQPTEQTVFVEIFGIDLDNQNEQLIAYTIAADGVNFSPNGVRFQLPASGASFPAATYKPQNNKFVFRDQGFEFEPGLTNIQSTPTRLQFSSEVIGSEDVANITSENQGFFRVPVVIPANTSGVFGVVIDMNNTEFGGAGAPITLTRGQQGVINVVPEPASLGLIVLGGLLTLRRRRVA